MSPHATRSLPLLTLLLRYLPIVFLCPHAPSLPTNASVLPIILTTQRTKTHGLTYSREKKVLCCIHKMSSTHKNMSRVAPGGHILTETPQLFPKFTLMWHTKAVNALAISPSGSMLLSGGKQFHFRHDWSDAVQSGNDSRIVIWSLSSEEMIQEVCVPSTGFISCLKWIGLSDQEDTFVFGASDGISISTDDARTSRCFHFVQSLLHMAVPSNPSHGILFVVIWQVRAMVKLSYGTLIQKPVCFRSFVSRLAVLTFQNRPICWPLMPRNNLT